MSHAMTFEQMIHQLDKWHVDYKVTRGAKTRNRAGHGAWGDMNGDLSHHDASPARMPALIANRVLKGGRSDLPGPLCNFSVGRGGTVYVIGWGRANHAGSVRPAVLDRFVTDTHPVRPGTTQGETVDGNAFLYGTEVHNNGLGEKYGKRQMLNLVLLKAAVLDFHKWTPNSSAQHYEVTARKVDMAPVRIKGQVGSAHAAGPWLRREVGFALAAGPGKYTHVGWRPSEPDPPPPPPPPPVVLVCAHCCPLHCPEVIA